MDDRDDLIRHEGLRAYLYENNANGLVARLVPSYAMYIDAIKPAIVPDDLRYGKRINTRLWGPEPDGRYYIFVANPHKMTFRFDKDGLFDIDLKD